MAVIDLYGSGVFAVGVPGYSGLRGIQNPPTKKIISAKSSKIEAYGAQNFGRGNEEVLVEYSGFFKLAGKGGKTRLKGGTVYGFESFTTGGTFSGFTVAGVRIDANEFRYGDASTIEQYFLGESDTIIGSIYNSETTAFLHGGDDSYEAYAGINTVSLGAGNDTYTSIGGYGYVEGGVGADVFDPHIGDGFIWVKDFEPGVDKFRGFAYMTGYATTDPNGRPALGVGISSDSVLAIFTGLSDISQL
jgi:hypothetical protein